MTSRIGPHTSGQAHPSPATQSLPADLAAVALIDAKTCAAIGAMSVSWWHERVAAGDAPQPVIRRPRCTRWRSTDAAEFWRTFAQQRDSHASARVKAQARKASAAAQTKRAAQAQQ